MTRRQADIFLAAVFFATFLGAVFLASLLDWRAAVLPFLLGMIGLPVSLGAFVQHIKLPLDNAARVLKPGDLVSFSWLILCFLSILFAGFELGGFLFAAAYFRWSAAFSWKRVLLLAAPVPIVAWIAFEMILGRLSFKGLLFYVLL